MVVFQLHGEATQQGFVSVSLEAIGNVLIDGVKHILRYFKGELRQFSISRCGHEKTPGGCRESRQEFFMCWGERRNVPYRFGMNRRTSFTFPLPLLSSFSLRMAQPTAPSAIEGFKGIFRPNAVQNSPTRLSDLV